MFNFYKIIFLIIIFNFVKSNETKGYIFEQTTDSDFYIDVENMT